MAPPDNDDNQIPSVLIVEDSTTCQRLWRRYLSTIRCRTITTSCGHRALESVRHEHPDAIVLDVILPDLDGWRVLQSLKNNKATLDIPVVMCSALDQRELGLSLGAADYLRKPVSLSLFLDALARVGIC